MKTLKHFLIISLGFCLITACSSDNTSTEINTQEEVQDPKAFNQELATELGANEYGMKFYVMGFLKLGPNQNQDSLTVAELQRAHLANISRLASERKLVVSGSFMDDSDLRGVYIFDAKTVEEVQEMLKTDPALKAGRLEIELHPWYGSASLMKTAEIHGTIAKTKN